MIIGICGKAQSGKDTTANYLVKELGFKRISFGDKLKDIVVEMFKLTRSQVDTTEGKGTVDLRYGVTPRTILQHIGTEGFRYIAPTVWVDYAMDKIKANPDIDWVISDVRFPEEIQGIKDSGGYAVRIERIGHQELNGKEARHDSEISIDQIANTDFDLVIQAKTGDLDFIRDSILNFVIGVVKVGHVG